MLPGLCSVALRHLDPAQVVACAIAGGAAGIEWEARVHVPPGDWAKAARAAELAAEAGLAVPSYGAYARAGLPDARQEFASCLTSADALGAPLVRVWTASVEGLSRAERDDAVTVVAADLADFCDRAADSGKTVSLEFHPGTFTEDAQSTLNLIDRVSRTNLRSHWQPDYGQTCDAAAASLGAMLPFLSHMHVFHWTKDHLRLPLDDGASYWKTLLKLASPASPLPSGGRYAMLEFSPNDDAEQVVADLRTLCQILAAS